MHSVKLFLAILFISMSKGLSGQMMYIVNSFEFDTIFSSDALEKQKTKSIECSKIRLGDAGAVDTIFISKFDLDTAGRIVFAETNGRNEQSWKKIITHFSYFKDTVQYETSVTGQKVHLTKKLIRVPDRYMLSEESVVNVADSMIIYINKDSFVRTNPFETVNYNYVFDFAQKIVSLNSVSIEKNNSHGNIVSSETEYFSKRYLEAFDFQVRRAQKVITICEYNGNQCRTKWHSIGFDGNIIAEDSLEKNTFYLEKLGLAWITNLEKNDTIHEFQFEGIRLSDKKIDFSNDYVSSTEYLQDSPLPKRIAIILRDEVHITRFYYRE